MRSRHILVTQLKDFTLLQLVKEMEDPTNREKMLFSLILQVNFLFSTKLNLKKGLIQLLEKKVEILCLQEDVELINKLIPEIEKSFNELVVK